MSGIKKIDFTKLLGFETVSDQLPGGVDFQDETVAAKLGAKVGIDVTEPARSTFVTLLRYDVVDASRFYVPRAPS
jgi:hypothetical protein